MTRKKIRTPPKSGPNPQGLNINYNTVKTVKLEKINGNRQSLTQRGKKRINIPSEEELQVELEQEQNRNKRSC